MSLLVHAASLFPCRRSSFPLPVSRARRACTPPGALGGRCRSRCSATSSPRPLAVGAPRVVTADDEARRSRASSARSSPRIPAAGRARPSPLRSPASSRAPILIVNADVPCVVPDDLRALLAATPAGGIALVEALDGTTNALGLSAPRRSRRSTAATAPPAFAHTRTTSASRPSRSPSRISPTTSTRSTTWNGCSFAAARARRRASSSFPSERCR